jgi:hypothetical protein
MPVKPVAAAEPVATEAEGFSFDPEKHIVIAFKVYERESLGEDLKSAIGHINYADQELASMDANLRVFRIGRDRMVELLVQRIEEDGLEPVAIVPSPEPEAAEE